MRVFLLITLTVIELVLASPVWAAESIGRLFTTPAERSNLDYLRQTKKVLPAVINTPTEDTISAAEPVALPDAINLQGYVKRSDGKKGTIWVNNKALQENSGNKDVVVGKLPTEGNRVPIKLPANGKQLTLKAGQVYDPENNRVREARSHGAQGEKFEGTIGEDANQR